MRRFVWITLAVVLAYPQAVSAKDLMKIAGETEGLPASERVAKICGERTSKLCRKLRDNPKYRDLWLSTADKLNKASRAADAAIARLKAELKQAKEQLDKLRDAAFKLADGTPIYPDNEGDFYRENGSLVTSEFAYTNKGRKFSVADYKAVIQFRNQKRKELRALGEYQKKLQRK